MHPNGKAHFQSNILSNLVFFTEKWLTIFNYFVSSECSVIYEIKSYNDQNKRKHMQIWCGGYSWIFQTKDNIFLGFYCIVCSSIVILDNKMIWVYRRKAFSTEFFVYLIMLLLINICSDSPSMFQKFLMDDIFHIPSKKNQRLLSMEFFFAVGTNFSFCDNQWLNRFL